MKKVDAGYVAKWYGSTFLIALILFAVAIVAKIQLLFFAAIIAVIVLLIAVPGMISKKMSKNALAMERSFSQQNFTYQYKFTSNSGVFYIDTSGRLGVVWKYNPTQLYFADLSKVTDIRVHDGKQLRGTALVSCQFNLEGKRIKIYTLRVSGGQLSMHSPKVIEAIEKANTICAMLSEAKSNAVG